MAEVLVKTTSDQSFKQEIKAGSHTFVSDIPEAMGGTEQGPDPHELLLGSLGACTSITVQMYAKRKGWDLKSVKVKLTEEKVADPENESRSIPRIVRELEFEGDLTDEQVEALRAIADKCPVHKLISGPKQIETAVRHVG